MCAAILMALLLETDSKLRQPYLFIFTGLLPSLVVLLMQIEKNGLETSNQKHPTGVQPLKNLAKYTCD